MRFSHVPADWDLDAWMKSRLQEKMAASPGVSWDRPDRTDAPRVYLKGGKKRSIEFAAHRGTSDLWVINQALNLVFFFFF